MVVLVIGYAIFAVLFAALGIFFSSDKCASKIAEHNTLPQYERNKIDEERFCRFIGRILCIFAACIVVAIVGVIMKLTWLHLLGWGIVVFVLIIALFYTGTKDRFKKN